VEECRGNREENQEKKGDMWVNSLQNTSVADIANSPSIYSLRHTHGRLLPYARTLVSQRDRLCEDKAKLLFALIKNVQPVRASLTHIEQCFLSLLSQFNKFDSSVFILL
jgi:hypothetical protein